MLLALYGMVKDIFTLYIFSRIFDKRENMYNAKISTFTVITVAARFKYTWNFELLGTSILFSTLFVRTQIAQWI